MAYKTKTMKKNALKAIQSKAMKLFAAGAISMKDADNISKIVNLRMKQL
jgi:DNA-binding transcriptional regulator YiaG